MAAGETQTIDMGASMETEQGLAIIDALNDVSDVQSMAGSEVAFAGTRVATFAGPGNLEGIDVFSCTRGWFILFRVAGGGPNWCTAGSEASEAVVAIDDDALRERVRQQLRDVQLL
jgi:hypothetical protein